MVAVLINTRRLNTVDFVGLLGEKRFLDTLILASDRFPLGSVGDGADFWSHRNLAPVVLLLSSSVYPGMTVTS